MLRTRAPMIVQATDLVTSANVIVWMGTKVTTALRVFARSYVLVMELTREVYVIATRVGKAPSATCPPMTVNLPTVLEKANVSRADVTV